MKKLLTIAIFSGALYACSNQTENQETTETAAASATESIAPILTKAWETDSVMTTAESTLYDKSTGIIYVSNIDGDPAGKDGKGFISKMTPDGTVSELQWVTGLNAPKGLAITGDKLYVTDVDALVEISLADGKILNRYQVPGAIFLNDAATNGEKVYFSDTRAGKLHVLDNGKVSTVAENLENLNGLAFNETGELFLLNGQGLLKYDLENKSTSAVNEVVTGGDGLVIIDDSTYIASRWQGEIYLVKGGKEHLLLDTKAQESNTADIDYIAEQNLVLVPTFRKNKVVAYKLEY